jgi:hypothetical protein
VASDRLVAGFYQNLIDGGESVLPKRINDRPGNVVMVEDTRLVEVAVAWLCT